MGNPGPWAPAGPAAGPQSDGYRRRDAAPVQAPSAPDLGAPAPDDDLPF